jgi:hypothetical protein
VTGLLAAPASADATLAAALQVICSGHAGAQPDAPGTPSNHVGHPCSLCAVGHGPVTLPRTAAAMAAPAGIVAEIRPATYVVEAPPAEIRSDSRPRAPPRA